jgi:Nucleotidyl transferase AbiEii toxin, Type IV TA system
VIDRTELLRLAGEFGLEPRIVEKDYVLSWVLAGIYRDPVLSATWIFKGGTCLKKCFFETYRFSEDLDFTITDAAQLDCQTPGRREPGALVVPKCSLARETGCEGEHANPMKALGKRWYARGDSNTRPLAS